MRPTRTALAARHSHDGRKWKLRTRVNSSRRAGTRVMASTAATIIARVLVYASGLKSRPSCASSVRTGRNETAITNRQYVFGWQTVEDLKLHRSAALGHDHATEVPKVWSRSIGVSPQLRRVRYVRV